MSKVRILMLFVFVLHASPLFSQQTVVTFNSGVDNSGNLLPDGAVDPHFSLISYPGQVGSTPASAFALAGITHTYITTGTQSRWISWDPNWIDATPSGVWIYRTTFDLTGFQPETAQLIGQFVSDNDGTLFINGVNTGIINTAADTFTPFNITSGFVDGINTVDFRVINDPFLGFNPSALRADLSVTAAIPEPSSLLLGAGVIVAGMTWYVRSRRKQRQLAC